MTDAHIFNTISIFRLLRDGTLDISRGQLYEDRCYVITDVNDRELHKGESLFRYPTRLDLFAVMFCQQGEITLTCDLQQLSIGANMILVVRPGSIVQVTSTRDCKVSTILSSGDFFEQLNLSIQKVIPLASAFSQSACLTFTPEQFRYLHHLAIIVSESIAQPHSLPYYHEAVRCSVRTFGYGFLSLWLQKMEQPKDQHILSHHEATFRRFIQLVTENYREQRKIAFYANQMNLTPKYLSKLIRETSGRGPSEWIDEYVVLESKNLLKYSTLSIQEVSYSLNFPNQSFFGRWFKSHTGSSPKAYRESK